MKADALYRFAGKKVVVQLIGSPLRHIGWFHNHMNHSYQIGGPVWDHEPKPMVLLVDGDAIASIMLWEDGSQNWGYHL